MSNDRVRQAQIKRLELVMKRPENRECFECTSKQPRWASTNLGIFFCLNCSGVHRSLGVHITKVKSTTMDTWEESMMQCVERIGNERGKELYEAEGFKGPKLDTNCTSQERERYIRKKYEQRAYYAKNFDDLYAQFLASGPPGGGSTVPASPALSMPTATTVDTSRPMLATTNQTTTAPATGGNKGLDWGDFGTASPSSGSPASPQPMTAQGAAANKNDLDNLFQPSHAKTTSAGSPAATANHGGDFGTFQTATPTNTPTTGPTTASSYGGGGGGIQVGTVVGGSAAAEPSDSLMSFKPAAAPQAKTVEKVQPNQQTNDILAAFGNAAGSGPRMATGGSSNGMSMQGPPPLQQQPNIFAPQQQQQQQFHQHGAQQGRPQPVWAAQNNNGFF